jgi:hypothetical protein
MRDFKVGQRVLCIDDHIIPITVPPYIDAGNVYTITKIVPMDWERRCKEDDDLFEVYEIPLASFFAWRFKPLDDTSLDIFRKMCVNEPAFNKLELMYKEKSDPWIYYDPVNIE